MLIGIICVGLLVHQVLSQAFSGEAIPITQRIDATEFLRFRFLTLVFGREGPMDTPLTTAPVMGREYFVEADLHGIESASSVRFQLIDAAGRELDTIPVWKASDSFEDGEFNGFVTVPSQPFRVVVTGVAVNGASIRSVFATLFQPASSGIDAPPAIPPGIPATNSNQIQNMMNAYREQIREQARRAAAEHPDGTLVMSRTVVSPIRYEPLLSPSGSPVGIRLRYSIRFSSQQTIRAIPHVFPEYAAAQWRGIVAMKPLTGTIAPLPQMVGVQSLQDVIQYEGAATYAASTSYTFTIDMIPDFVFQGTQSKRYCVFTQKVTNREIWNALISSTDAVAYNVSISDTGTAARIPASYPQKTFYQSFVADGAGDCGSVPNIRF